MRKKLTKTANMNRIFTIVAFFVLSTCLCAQKKNTDDTVQKKKQDVVQSADNQKNEPSQGVSDTKITPGASGVKRSIGYRFDTSVSQGDPGEGNFRFNNGEVSGITFISIDNVDISGEDQNKWYSTWDNVTGAMGRGRISLVEPGGKNIDVFDIIGLFVREEGYWKIPVKYVSGSLPAEGKTLYCVFERIENKKKETEPAKPAEPAPVIEPAKPAEPTPVIEPAKPAEPIAVVEPAKPAEPAPVVEPAKPAEPVAVIEPAKPAEPAQPKKAEKPVVPAKVREMEQPGKHEEPVLNEASDDVARHVQKPAGNQKPVQPSQTVQITQQAPATKPAQTIPAEKPAKPAEPAPVIEPAKPAQVAEPAKPAEPAPVVQPAPQKQPAQQATREKQPVQQTTRQNPAQPAANTFPQKPAPSAQTQQPVQREAETRVTQPAQKSQQVNVYNPYASLPGYNSGTSSFSNTGSGHRKWYHGIIEIGYAAGLGKYGVDNFRFNFINGIYLCRTTSIGLGIGYRRYFDKLADHPDRSLVSGISQVPVFLDLRTRFSTRHVTPYLAFGIGGASSTVSGKSRTEGIFLTPSGGIWINISDRFGVFGGIAWELQRLEYVRTSDNSHFYKNSNSLSLNLGISF